MQGVTITSQDSATASVHSRLAGEESGSALPLDAALALFRREAAARGLPGARVRSVVSYVRSSVPQGRPAGLSTSSRRVSG